MRAVLQIQKEILRRKGIIKTARVRGPADPLEEDTVRDLNAVCDALGIG
jgi:hypothetical protein